MVNNVIELNVENILLFVIIIFLLSHLINNYEGFDPTNLPRLELYMDPKATRNTIPKLRSVPAKYEYCNLEDYWVFDKDHNYYNYDYELEKSSCGNLECSVRDCEKYGNNQALCEEMSGCSFSGTTCTKESYPCKIGEDGKCNVEDLKYTKVCQ